MSQKTDNLIKLALVFFVSLLSFSIGTYVGKKYSDNQHKLATLEPQKAEAPTASSHEFDSEKDAPEAGNAIAAAEAKLGTVPDGQTAAGAIGTEHAGALTDTEVAKLAEEFATEDDTKTPEAASAVGTIAKDEKPVGTISAKAALENKIKTTRTTAAATTAPVTETITAQTTTAPAATVAVKKPVAPATTAPVVAATPRPVATPASTALPKKEAVKTSAETAQTIQPTPRDARNDEREPASLPPKQEIIPIHYTVQIGSYATETEASELTKSLQGKGYKTSYIPAKVNGQVWYRVNVGLFGTIKEAQDYKKDFLEKTNLSSAIIQRVQR